MADDPLWDQFAALLPVRPVIDPSHPHRRDEWMTLGVFEQLKMIVLQAYDRIVGLLLEDISIDGCITKAPGGGEVAGRSPVDRGARAG